MEGEDVPQNLIFNNFLDFLNGIFASLLAVPAS